MYIYELAALAAATLWAYGGLISAAPAATMGAIRFNQLRMVIVTIMLAVFVLLTGRYQSFDWQYAWPMFVSGFIGIFIGDSLLFLTLIRLGPRRTAIIFSTNAVMSVLLGWMFLGEALTFQEFLGIVLILIGVFLAIVYGKRRGQLHKWEEVKGKLWVGVVIGLGAALSQSVGSIVAKPVMESGQDPFFVSMMRVGVAAVFLSLLIVLPGNFLPKKANITWPLTSIVAFSGFIGMGLGMTLLLFGLSGGNVGVISTLSATTPAVLLPMIWIKTREMPAIGAWLGASLVVIGSSLLFMH
jgi:drug/metabolite transporter (DMT)-like permease